MIDWNNAEIGEELSGIHALCYGFREVLYGHIGMYLGRYRDIKVVMHEYGGIVGSIGPQIVRYSKGIIRNIFPKCEL